MKRLRIRFSILVMALFTCAMLTGCSAGSKIYTNLVINEDLSGVRKMDVEIDNNAFNEYFSGTIDDLNNIIATNCPGDLTYSYVEVDGVMTYHFEIAFSSPEDYQQKVRNITAQENVITINAPDTVWASGFYISEDFSSASLLNWLKDAIVSNELVSASNASYIFSEGDCAVNYGEEVFSTNSIINVDTVEVLSIDSIDLLTRAVDISQYDRTVVFTVSNEAMQQKGEAILTFFEKHLPNGAENVWTEDETGASVYTVTLNGINADDITAMNAALFGTETSVYTSTEVVDNLSPFTFAVYNSEAIDLSQYIASDSQNIKITSSIAVSDNILYGEDAYSAEAISTWYAENEKYPGYYTVVEKNVWGGSPYTDSYSIQKKYNVKELDILTNKTLTGNYEREFTFTFDSIPTEAEQEIFLARLEAPFAQTTEDTTSENVAVTETTAETVAAKSQAEEETENVYNVDFANKVKEDVYTLSIKQKGTAREIEEATALLTKCNAEVSYGEKFAFSKLKYDEVYTESIRLGELLYNTTDDFICNYEVNLGLGSKISNVNYEDAVIKGSKFTLTTSNIPSNIYVISQKLNLWAFAFYIFLIGGIVFIGIAVKRSEIIAPAAPKTEEIKITPAQEEDKGSFCTNCGAPRDDDACVCVKCGTKF